MHKPHINTNSQDSSPPGLGESHHLPPYSILCAWSHDQHPNVIFVLGFLSWSPEILKIETFAILETHNFVCKLPIEMKSEEKL